MFVGWVFVPVFVEVVVEVEDEELLVDVEVSGGVPVDVLGVLRVV